MTWAHGTTESPTSVRRRCSNVGDTTDELSAQHREAALAATDYEGQGTPILPYSGRVSVLYG